MINSQDPRKDEKLDSPNIGFLLIKISNDRRSDAINSLLIEFQDFFSNPPFNEYDELNLFFPIPRPMQQNSDTDFMIQELDRKRRNAADPERPDLFIQNLYLALQFSEQINDIKDLLEEFAQSASDNRDNELMEGMSQLAKTAKEYLAGKKIIDDIKAVSPKVTDRVKKESTEDLIKIVKGQLFFSIDSPNAPATGLEAFKSCVKKRIESAEKEKAKEESEKEQIKAESLVIKNFNSEISKIWSDYLSKANKKELPIKYKKMVGEVNIELERYFAKFFNREMSGSDYQRTMVKFLDRQKTKYCEKNKKMDKLLTSFIEKYSVLFEVQRTHTVPKRLKNIP